MFCHQTVAEIEHALNRPSKVEGMMERDGSPKECSLENDGVAKGGPGQSLASEHTKKEAQGKRHGMGLGEKDGADPASHQRMSTVGEKTERTKRSVPMIERDGRPKERAPCFIGRSLWAHQPIKLGKTTANESSRSPPNQGLSMAGMQDSRNLTCSTIAGTGVWAFGSVGETLSRSWSILKQERDRDRDRT